MATILEVRAAIVERLRPVFPGVDVEEHPRAQFTSDDLKDALKNKSLAFRVAFTGVPDDAEASDNEVDSPCAWAVYVMAKDVASSLPRDRLILGSVPRILLEIARGGWTTGEDESEFDGQHNVKKLRVAHLYEGEVDSKSAAIWCVTWMQTLTFSIPESELGLRQLLTLGTSHDLAAADGVFEATDTINMRSTP